MAKRYDITYPVDGGGECSIEPWRREHLEEAEDGDWVAAEEYDADLATERERGDALERASSYWWIEYHAAAGKPRPTCSVEAAEVACAEIEGLRTQRDAALERAERAEEERDDARRQYETDRWTHRNLKARAEAAEADVERLRGERDAARVEVTACEQACIEWIGEAECQTDRIARAVAELASKLREVARVGPTIAAPVLRLAIGEAIDLLGGKQ